MFSNKDLKLIVIIVVLFLLISYFYSNSVEGFEDDAEVLTEETPSGTYPPRIRKNLRR